MNPAFTESFLWYYGKLKQVQTISFVKMFRKYKSHDLHALSWLNKLSTNNELIEERICNSVSNQMQLIWLIMYISQQST